MLRHVRFSILPLLATLLALAACTTRGPLQYVPEGTEPGETVAVFEASNRSYGIFDSPRRGRVATAQYGRVDLRIPDMHVMGEVQLPGNVADPTQHFLVAEKEDYRDGTALIEALRKEIRQKPDGSREITVFAPGFNMSAAQSVTRTAQLKHDLDLPGIVALFNWASAGSVLGYAYDRDSALFSRDSYEQFLRDLAKAEPEGLVLVSHSMGTLLTMEVLRQISAPDPDWIDQNISGVVLISPDIDTQVFRTQIARMARLPSPFVIMVSEQDRALALSARVSGDGQRLGAVTDPADLADLDVILLDVSNFSSGMGHFSLGSSPALIGIIGQLARIETSFEGDPAARAGLIPGTILTVQNATRIILSPIAE